MLRRVGNSSPPRQLGAFDSSHAVHDRILAQMDMLTRTCSPHAEGGGLEQDSSLKGGYIRPPSRGAESWRPLGESEWMAREGGHYSEDGDITQTREDNIRPPGSFH